MEESIKSRWQNNVSIDAIKGCRQRAPARAAFRRNGAGDPSSCRAGRRREKHATGAYGGVNLRRGASGFGGAAGRHGRRQQQHRAYLAQQQNPPFAMPVWHYLTLHQPDKTRTGQLNEVADMLELGDKLGRSVNQLSGVGGSVFALLPLYYKFIPTLSGRSVLLNDEPMNRSMLRNKTRSRSGITSFMSGRVRL